MTAVIYLVVAGLAAIGLAQTMRSQARGRRYLENSPDEHPLQLSHLSRPLQTLLRDTRALRLALEGPLRQLSESAMLGDHEELQQHLHDSARELGEWLRELDRLPKNDREYVADAGADPDRIRTLFELEGWSFDRKRPQGQPPLRDRMRAIVDELRAFEERLQVPPNPYR